MSSPDAATPGRLDDEQRCGLEAVLFLADEPVEVRLLAEVLEVDQPTVTAALEELAATLRAERRGFELRSVAGGWRFYTAAAARTAVERWALSGRTGRLTQAALETLAVIAYKQPIARHDIGEIRGVNPDGAVRSLVARGLVTEVGRDEGPGQAVLYGTTTTFLERVGLATLEELPPLTDFLPEAPAPDEPELGALRDIRRRLAAGGELPGAGLGGRSPEQTNTGTGPDEDDDGELLPPPRQAAGTGRQDAEMDELADRLDVVARNAVGRLRAVMAAGDDQRDPAGAPDDEHEAAGTPDDDHETEARDDG